MRPTLAMAVARVAPGIAQRGHFDRLSASGGGVLAGEGAVRSTPTPVPVPLGLSLSKPCVFLPRLFPTRHVAHGAVW